MKFINVINMYLNKLLFIQISDFRLSKWKNYSRSLTTGDRTQGTPSHISPELWLIEPTRPNEKSDVYSFSILAWEIYAESPAFENCGGNCTKS